MHARSSLGSRGPAVELARILVRPHPRAAAAAASPARSSSSTGIVRPPTVELAGDRARRRVARDLDLEVRRIGRRRRGRRQRRRGSRPAPWLPPYIAVDGRATSSALDGVAADLIAVAAAGERQRDRAAAAMQDLEAERSRRAPRPARRACRRTTATSPGPDRRSGAASTRRRSAGPGPERRRRARAQPSARPHRPRAARHELSRMPTYQRAIGLPACHRTTIVHRRAHTDRRLREGLARGSDLEPSRPARAREDAPRAVAQLARDAHAEAVDGPRPRQDPPQARRVRARPGQRRERPVGRPRRSSCRCRTAPIARAINRQILRATIRALRLRLGIERVPAVDVPAERRGLRRHARRGSSSVYYCVDEWSMFSYLDRAQTVAAERRAARAGRRGVRDQPRARRRQARGQPGDLRVAARRRSRAVRARARSGARRCPPTSPPCPRPRIGFYGTLRDWVDFELIAHVARARPRWSIALIGQELGDLSALARPAERPPARPEAPRRVARVLQGLRRRHHPVPHRRADDVRQPAQAARVPVGRPARRVDAGARGGALRAHVPDRRDARGVRRGDRRGARARPAPPRGAPARTR